MVEGWGEGGLEVRVRGGVFAGIVFWVGGKGVGGCFSGRFGLGLLWLGRLRKVVYLFLVERFLLF